MPPAAPSQQTARPMGLSTPGAVSTHADGLGVLIAGGQFLLMRPTRPGYRLPFVPLVVLASDGATTELSRDEADAAAGIEGTESATTSHESVTSAYASLLDSFGGQIHAGLQDGRGPGQTAWFVAGTGALAAARAVSARVDHALDTPAVGGAETIAAAAPLAHFVTEIRQAQCAALEEGGTLLAATLPLPATAFRRLRTLAERLASADDEIRQWGLDPARGRRTWSGPLTQAIHAAVLSAAA